jgi:hypothetical protein
LLLYEKRTEVTWKRLNINNCVVNFNIQK